MYYKYTCNVAVNLEIHGAQLAWCLSASVPNGYNVVFQNVNYKVRLKYISTRIAHIKNF